MKKIAFVFLLFSASMFYGQNLTGYFVNNQNDTIKCKFEFVAPRFDVMSVKDELKFNRYLASLNKKLTVILENGEKLILKPKDIKLFYIKRKDFERYKFVSLKEDLKQFYEEVFTGKISVYYSHWSDDAPKSTYYLKDGKLAGRETNFVNFRNWIGEMIADSPDLHARWMDSDKYYQKKDVFDVIKIYNVDFLNKG